MGEKNYFVYILFNKQGGTLYVGVTSDLIKRVYQHKTNTIEGFAKKYGVDKLGCYEMFGDISAAIKREKQLKAGSRAVKLHLISEMNPN